MRKLLLVVIPFFLAACALSQGSVEATPSSMLRSFSSTFTPTATLSASPAVTDTQMATSIEITSTAASMPTLTPIPTLESGQPIILTTLNMMNATIGWAIESTSHLLRSIDGGITWQDVTPPESGFFSFIDTTHAWAVVEAQIPCNVSTCQWLDGLVMWQTSDGGQTWQRGVPFVPGVFYHQPIAIQFAGDASGWFLFVERIGMSHSTYESLLRTNDGGKSWIPSQGNLDTLCISGGMVFLNEQDGWIGDDCRWNMGAMDGTRLQDFLNGQAAPSLMQTSDGGKSWPDYSLIPPPKIFPPNLISPNADPNTEFWCGVTKMERISQKAFTLQWSCSHYFPDPPTEIFSYSYLTSDSGRNWHTWLATGNESFVSATTGWRLFLPGEDQSSQLQQTTDGGLTWTNLKTVAWQSAQFDFVSEQVGWAIISDDTNTALVHTTDGGKTWTLIKPTVVP